MDLPDRARVKDLLTRYFIGPIGEAQIDVADAEFRDNWEHQFQAYQSHFESPTEWRGKAWREEFTHGRRYMNAGDMLLMYANMMASAGRFPEPKLFCPQQFVGTWVQVEPPPTVEPALWHLDTDGSFRSNSPQAPRANFWCVIRNGDDVRPGSLAFSNSRLDSPGWSIARAQIQDNELVGVHPSAIRDKPFRFRRA
jgi:hypothetical protein